MLGQISSRLDRHFQALSRERAAHGYPVYSLEHELNISEVAELKTELSADLARTGRVRSEHWLPWAVLATEIGYTYDGDEYWHSFASEVPPWRSSGARSDVREWFVRFAARFNGFHPTGRWADHFSIIAWPITHSILPKYLQFLFARHLYELRHDLAGAERVGVDEIGHLLERQYHGGSSRLEHLLQQTALTTRIVLALRDEDVVRAVTPIYRPTLARIIGDLEARGSSRSYLCDARRVLRDARIVPVAGIGGQASRPSPQTSKEQKSPSPGIALVGRRSHGGSWMLCLALPDFGALTLESGISKALLDRSRMAFEDRPETWMPGRALLSYANSRYALTRSPGSMTGPLIGFRGPPEVGERLASYLALRSQPPWLLRIHADGIARQVLGNHVRATEQYLVACTSEPAEDVQAALSLEKLDCRTEGIFLFGLQTPSVIRQPLLDALAQLSFGYALRARVRPYGMVARWDDAQAVPVWLTGEEIILHLSADFDVAEFKVTSPQTGTRFKIEARDDQALISLGSLSVGRHAIEVDAVPAQSQSSRSGPKSILPEIIEFEVRSPTPWRRSADSRSGLRIVLHPPAASFDDLAAKRAVLELQGPDDRNIAAVARLYDTAGHVSEARPFGQIKLPSTEAVTGRLIDRLSMEPLAEAIRAAPRIELTFSAEELGEVSCAFSHKVPLLRWKLEHGSSNRRIRLVDEAHVADAVVVNRYEMTVPDRRLDLSTADCLAGIPLLPPGALFVARHDGRVYSAFVSALPPGKVAAFSEFAIGVNLAAPGKSSRGIPRLLALLRLWRPSQALGPLAAFRKTKVIEELELQIERLACGERWVQQAKRYKQGELPLERLQTEVGGSAGFASRLRSHDWIWHRDSAHAANEFRRLAALYGICDDNAICDLALLLAFDPKGIALGDPARKSEFEELGTKQELARGAYLAKLVSEVPTGKESSSGAPA